MLAETKTIFKDSHLRMAASFYEVDSSKLKEHDGFESFVYEFERDNKAYILKISHSLRRSVDYIMGELEFVNYLSDNGVKAARAVPSVNDRMVEIIEVEDGSHLFVYAFEKIDGRMSEYKDWNDDFIKHWGQFSGKMNALSKEFKPSDEKYRRQLWYQDDIYNFEKHINPKEEKTIKNCRKIFSHIKTYQTSRDDFGLIHGDFHQGNFFINKNKEIEIFDFDDCEHHYFINDIAMPLYYATPNDDKKYGIKKEEFAGFFLSNFLKGYYKEYRLDKKWIEAIPDFLRLRSVIMFALVDQIWDPAETNDRKTAFIARHKSFINDGVPVIDIDFGKFVK